MHSKSSRYAHFGSTEDRITWIFYIVVRFLVLVTTMVTKVDHGNHRSNDCGNHRSNYDGYHNAFFLQEYIFLDDFFRFSIIFDLFHT